jgi:hypothetical protein
MRTDGRRNGHDEASSQFSRTRLEMRQRTYERQSLEGNELALPHSIQQRTNRQEKCCHMGCNTAQSGRKLHTFRRSLLPPFLG